MTNRQTIHKFLCWYGIIGTLTAGQVGCSLGPMSLRQLSNGTKMDPMQWPPKEIHGPCPRCVDVCANLFMGNTDNS